MVEGVIVAEVWRSARPGPAAHDVLVLAEIVELIRSGRADTRPALEAITGLGRKAVAQRVRDGLDLGILEDGGLAPSGGGRAPRKVGFRAGAGLLLAAHLGASECTAAVTRLDGSILELTHVDSVVGDGPEEVLAMIHRLFEDLLGRFGGDRSVWGIGIGVPGPVEFVSGTVIDPPIMPGWDGFDVRAWFQHRWAVPVWVDNDVNLMALAEWERGEPRERRDLLFVKVGTGVGSALISGGRLHRGDTGSAGDIGHIRATEDPSVICACGKLGCLEAVAGGWSMTRGLTERVAGGLAPVLEERYRSQGRLVNEDVHHAIAAGDRWTRARLVDSARAVGEVTSSIVNFVNPGVVVLGGGVLRFGPLFVRPFRDTIMSDSIELSTRRLSIRNASLEFREGVIGAALMVAEALFSRETLPTWIGNDRT